MFSHQCKEVAEDHNAESLASVLQNIFEDWKITGKVYGATTDNGGNIVNACVNHLKLMHMLCIGHTLQLAVKRALEINRAKRVLGQCRKCAEHFNKSTKATYKLREKQIASLTGGAHFTCFKGFRNNKQLQNV